MAHATMRVYRNGTLSTDTITLAQVSDVLEEAGTIVWVDFESPTQADLVELAEELGLHELATEDALSPHQRPKLDYYPSHLFLSAHAITCTDGAAGLVETEVNAFVSDRWLITVRKGDGFPIDEVVHRWDRSAHLAQHGVGYLLYGLLDVIVDGYFSVLDTFDSFYDEVSEGIFADQPLNPAEQRNWFEMRRALVRFHRLVVPMREAISGLMRREHQVVGEPILPYFQDVYDHILRVSESTESLRDLVATIVETSLSLRDYRQNQVMKRVTSWAAIAAVPTFITGFYGMNVPYPGAEQRWGVVAAVVLCFGASGGLYALFRKREWL